MFAWIAAHFATLIVCLVLLLIVAGAVWVLVRDKKKGKSICGGSCGCCPYSGSCHKK